MSKELEALDRLCEHLDLDDEYFYIKNGERADYATIEKALKALEIIREKGIILQFIKETYAVEQYNAGVFGTLVKPLTKEEYELLKEVLDE